MQSHFIFHNGRRVWIPCNGNVKPVRATGLRARNIGFLPSCITNGGGEQGGLGGGVIPALNDEVDGKERQMIDRVAIRSEWQRLVRMDSTENFDALVAMSWRGGGEDANQLRWTFQSPRRVGVDPAQHRPLQAARQVHPGPLCQGILQKPFMRGNQCVCEPWRMWGRFPKSCGRNVGAWQNPLHVTAKRYAQTPELGHGGPGSPCPMLSHERSVGHIMTLQD